MHALSTLPLFKSMLNVHMLVLSSTVNQVSFNIAQRGKGGETEGEMEFHVGLLPCCLPGKCVLMVFFCLCVCLFVCLCRRIQQLARLK